MELGMHAQLMPTHRQFKVWCSTYTTVIVDNFKHFNTDTMSMKFN